MLLESSVTIWIVLCKDPFDGINDSLIWKSISHKKINYTLKNKKLLIKQKSINNLPILWIKVVYEFSAFIFLFVILYVLFIYFGLWDFFNLFFCWDFEFGGIYRCLNGRWIIFLTYKLILSIKNIFNSENLSLVFLHQLFKKWNKSVNF